MGILLNNTRIDMQSWNLNELLGMITSFIMSVKHWIFVINFGELMWAHLWGNVFRRSDDSLSKKIAFDRYRKLS